MTIGLICAIPQELGPPAATALESRRDESGRRHARFDLGRLDGHEVVLVGAGIGKVNTALVATLLADRFGCRLIVFSGVAGGLDPALRIGDVVIADRTVQHDAGVIEDERLSHLPGRARAVLQPDRPARLPGRRRAARAAAGPARGLRPAAACPCAAGGEVRRRGSCSAPSCPATSTSTARPPGERLFRELGGAAVEMEGGALGQVAEAFGIPFLDIRALSDLAGKDSRFDFAAFVSEVAGGSAAILRHLLPVL